LADDAKIKNGDRNTMKTCVETEIKFLVSEDDAKRFIESHSVVSHGTKTMSYYDDVDKVFEKCRVTYRRYHSKNVVLDEIKTVTDWTVNRTCLERSAAALIQDLSPSRLTSSDVDVSIVSAIREFTNVDFVLQLKESLTVNRHVISVSNFAETFDVDICVSDNNVKFCEIEFESHNESALDAASQYILSMCQSANKSTLTKRERVRIQ
jgi:hypothetical protein